MCPYLGFQVEIQNLPQYPHSSSHFRPPRKKSCFQLKHFPLGSFWVRKSAVFYSVNFFSARVSRRSNFMLVKNSWAQCKAYTIHVLMSFCHLKRSSHHILIYAKITRPRCKSGIRKQIQLESTRCSGFEALLICRYILA